MNEQTFPFDKLRSLLDGEGSAEDKIQAIYDDFLPPFLPDLLFLAKATHPQYGEGIVISHNPSEEGDVRLMFPVEEIGDGTDYRWVNPTNLTFHTPDHPEFLETEEDYENAPNGTIVADSYCLPWAKNRMGLWLACGDVGCDGSPTMSTRPRRVIRWGEIL